MATEVLVTTGTPSVQPHVSVAAPLESSGSRRRRVDVGGVLLDHVELDGALKRIEQFVRSGRPHQIVTVNLDFLTIASRDESFRSLLNSADLAVADGMPV